jgi:signal transduction histidine kinase
VELTAPAVDAPLILVADDVPANVELLVDQLGALGYRAIAASNASQALAMSFEHRPDLCIFDVAMPAGEMGGDDRSAGFELCRRIKRDPRTARIPVIFVTALSDAADRIKAIEAGGDDFLTKPHNRLVLGARITSLLKLKAATDALEDSARKLRELEKLRDDLMKMIVHDLKTPLSSVLATMELLLDGDFGPLTPAQRAAVSDSENKAEDLLGLIDDLLEVRRMEEASLLLEKVAIAPGALLTEVAHEWTHRFQQEGSSVAIDVSDDAPVFRADRALIKRVLGNLIQNAITHSARAVAITLSVRREGSDALFTVADTGPGIPEEYQEIIFRKFEQVRTPSAPKLRGSGLGLAFCKLVVESHGGRIWVRSAGHGQGSAFHFVLPGDAEPAGTL